MSRIDNWSQAERDLYALGSRAILDDLERQQQEWRESWAPDSTSMDETHRQHAAKMRQLEEDQRQWFSRFIDGEADEPASTPDVAARGADDASLSPPSGSSRGHSPGQQPNPPAAELTADDIKAMSMADYQRDRERLIRASASTRGMFG